MSSAVPKSAPAATALHLPPHHPLAARVALRRHLLAPDGRALLADDGVPASPAGLAASLGVAFAGAAAFLLSAAVGLTRGEGLADVGPALVGGALLAALLTFPPLVLVSALRGRQADVLQLAASAAVGPTVAGTTLAAMAPVVLVHALGAEPDFGLALVVVMLFLLSLLAGAVATVKRSLATGASSAGPVAALVHYGLTLWTAGVLAVHLL
ncbi:MAG: hypothetical protein H6742_20155 [Alphaproteobacteria bacterium]|nr:hypothetical protein [Alphaproteobacteria bacterium]